MMEATIATLKTHHENSRKPRTLNIIAGLLGAQGFDEYAMRCVEYYYIRKAQITDRQKKRIENLRQAMRDTMKDLPPATRMIVGKFTHQQARMAFDAGLKIGLMTHATKMQADRLGLSEDDEAFKNANWGSDAD